MKQKEIGKSLLNSDNDTKDAVKQIVAATDSSYCLQNRAKVIHNNLRPVNHPYYSSYKYLQQLCLLILRHQSMQYSQSNSLVYGILFDGAWLWEEYLWTILKPLDFEHPENKTGKGGIRLFDNSKNDDEEIEFSKCYRRIYPDFYRENEIILDAKYKHLENGFIRDDLYQIISYMHTMKIPCGGFIYPLKKDDMEIKPCLLKLTGLGGEIASYGIPISENAENYSTFCTNLKKIENDLKKCLFSL